MDYKQLTGQRTQYERSGEEFIKLAKDLNFSHLILALDRDSRLFAYDGVPWCHHDINNDVYWNIPESDSDMNCFYICQVYEIPSDDWLYMTWWVSVEELEEFVDELIDVVEI